MRSGCIVQSALILTSLISVCAAKSIVGPLCLSNYDQKKTIACEKPGESLFIIQERYTNDLSGQCGVQAKNGTEECSGYLHNLKKTCNGKKQCEIQAEQASFEFGYQGAECSFKSEILFVSYECIPVNFDDKSIPKYDICSAVSIDHPVHGFLHSPNYPNSYSSNTYCQLSMDINAESQRLEVYLIKLETEGLSKRKWKPTDSLLVNNEYFYGTKQFKVIYNETDNVVFLFQTDTWFNYQGFYLYFKVITNKNKVEVKKSTIVADSTVATTSTVALSYANESTPETNKTQITLDSPIQYTDDPSLQLLQRDIILQSQERSFETNSSISNQTFIGLMSIIALMSVAIMYLIFTNRRKFFKKGQKKLGPEGIYLSKDLQIIHGNPAFVNPLIQQYGYKLNILNSAQPRTSNDSMAHLLSLNNTNGSISSSFVGPANFMAINPKTNEPYEDITGKEYHNSRHYLNAMLNNLSENEYCENPAITNNLLKSSALKLNEYCYIPASILQGCPTMYHNRQIISESLRENHEKNEKKFSTSTPSVPKTLPPSINDSCLISSLDVTSDSDGNSYDTLTKKSSGNDYKVCSVENFTITDKKDTLIEANSESVTVTEEKESVIDEYQIPSNIPTTE